MEQTLNQEIKAHWQQLRGRTYDLLDHLSDTDLARRLPFPESQTLGYQFWCMLGAQESWQPLLTKGVWEGFACSLNDLPSEAITVALIKNKMQAADQQLFAALDSGDLLRIFPERGTALAQYLRLAEHEGHHHGQLINFIYALKLPIPASWADEWALTRAE